MIGTILALLGLIAIFSFLMYFFYQNSHELMYAFLILMMVCTNVLLFVTYKLTDPLVTGVMEIMYVVSLPITFIMVIYVLIKLTFKIWEVRKTKMDNYKDTLV